MRGDRLLAVDSETEREETWELGDMGALRGAGWGDPFYWETSEHICIRALMFPNKTLFLTMEAGTVPSSLRLSSSEMASPLFQKLRPGTWRPLLPQPPPTPHSAPCDPTASHCDD